MSQDDKVIAYLTPAEMQALMRETGKIGIQEMEQSGGQPVIHALLKVVNAESGVELPGGLPFSVVMFKDGREPGYSNIAIGTVVPAAELGIVLPADFFNLCNRRFRFVRVFPLDATSFVLQMDLFLHNATREYVKYGLGVWSTLFTHILFELMGNGGRSLAAAAEVYAAAATAERFASVVTEEPLAEVPLEAAEEAETEILALPVTEPVAEEAILLEAEEPPPAAAEEPEAEAKLAEAPAAAEPAEAPADKTEVPETPGEK
jgi:hypothetical protein